MPWQPGDPNPNDGNAANALWLKSRDGTTAGNGTAAKIRPDGKIDDNFRHLLRLRGEWAPSVDHQRNEIVFYHGGQYAALVDNSTQVPSRTATDWYPLAGLSGSGGMELATETAITIGAGWTTLPVDQISLAGIGCTFDVPNNAFEFDWAGRWDVRIYFNIRHNEAQGSRSFDVRIFNITTGIGGGDVFTYVGRNQTGSQVTLTLLAEPTLGDIQNNDKFRVEIGNTSDSFSAVVANRVTIELIQVSI